MHTLLGFWELALIFILGMTSLPIPVGVPPLPENPALIRAVPETACVMVEWFGVGEPNAASRNTTERLAAEPELRQLVATMRDAIRRTAVRESGENAERMGFILDAVQLCMSRPGCAFGFNLAIERSGPSLAGGILVDLADGTAVVERGMRALSEMLREADGGQAPEPLSVGDVRMHALDPEAHSYWAVIDGYLVITIGENAHESVIAGLRPAAGHRGLDSNERYRTAQRRAAVARPSFRSFYDIGQIVESATSQVDREISGIVQILGIDAMQAMVSESGLEGTGFAQRSALSTEEMPGVLGLFAGRALEPADFAHVPADATVAFGLRAAPDQFLQRVFDLADSVRPGVSGMMRTEMFGDTERFLALDVQKDLLAHLGDSITVWSSPGSGGSLIYNGLTAAIPLRAADAFRDSFGKAMTRIESVATRDPDVRRPRGAFVERIDDHTVPIWFLNILGHDTIASPAWCVTDTHLVVSVFPQNIVEMLDRDEQSKYLEQDPEFAAHVAADDAVAVGMLDLASSWQLLYPILQIASQVAVGELQRDGFAVDMRAFPRYSSIAPHLGREMLRVDISKQGLTMSRRGTLPSVDPMLVMLLPLGAVGAAPFIFTVF